VGFLTLVLVLFAARRPVPIASSVPAVSSSSGLAVSEPNEPALRLSNGPCECGLTPTACTRYWNAPAFITGRVEAITRDGAGNRRITFAVSETGLHLASSTLVVNTGPANRRCSLSFQTGREYLVYLQPDEHGEWTTNVCLGTRAIEDAAADLEYLSALKSGSAPPGRISGQVLTTPRDLARTPRGPATPVAGISLRLTADGTEPMIAISDRAGDFSFEPGKVGRYSIASVVDDGRHYVEEHGATIDLRDPRACMYVERHVYNNGGIAGRVVDASGQPVSGLTIDLKPRASGSRLAAGLRQAMTDRFGRYEFTMLPTGTFVVGINIESTRTSSAVALPRIFHPGVIAVTRATAIIVPDGGQVTVADLRLSRNVSYVPVSGVVIAVNGQPAADARVYLKGAGEGETIIAGPVTTDPSGRFVIAGLANVGYRIFAERSQDDGQLRRLDSSDEMPVTAVPNGSPVRLPLRHRY
jgi:5-hydroxyisourate hydrolase-like protein (transthyretin family)